MSRSYTSSLNLQAECLPCEAKLYSSAQAPSSSLPWPAADHASACRDVNVKRTFINVSQPDADLIGNCRRRARSGGDEPAPGSSPVEARMSTPRSQTCKAKLQDIQGVGFHMEGALTPRRHNKPTNRGRAASEAPSPAESREAGLLLSPSAVELKKNVTQSPLPNLLASPSDAVQTPECYSIYEQKFARPCNAFPLPPAPAVHAEPQSERKSLPESEFLSMPSMPTSTSGLPAQQLQQPQQLTPEEMEAIQAQLTTHLSPTMLQTQAFLKAAAAQPHAAWAHQGWNSSFDSTALQQPAIEALTNTLFHQLWSPQAFSQTMAPAQVEQDAASMHHHTRPAAVKFHDALAATSLEQTAEPQVERALALKSGKGRGNGESKQGRKRTTKPSTNVHVQLMQLDEASSVFETASSVEEVFKMVDLRRQHLTVEEAISAIHLAAKLYDLDEFGNILLSASGGNGNARIQDGRLSSLVRFLGQNVTKFQGPRSYMQTIWALGKVGTLNYDVLVIVKHLGCVAQQLLPLFSAHELSNALWGLAWLSCTAEGGPRSNQCKPLMDLAHTLVAEAESSSRCRKFEGQCLSNGLWALAKLELRGQRVTNFAASCVSTMQQAGLSGTLPQGIANSLWACAKLQLAPALCTSFFIQVAQHITANPHLLSTFQSQELSMTIWAFAKVLATKGNGKHGSQQKPEVKAFALIVADEAHRRIDELSPQGLSNVAWALATMDLIKQGPCKNFVNAIATKYKSSLHSFPPQAIANICWSLARLEKPCGEHVQQLYKTAAQAAAARGSEFSWQDLSGIISAMMQGGVSAMPEVRWFAAALVHRATGQCDLIGTQALLNIALAATRLGVDDRILEPMARGIGEVFAKRSNELNEIDMRQWQAIKKYCNIPGVLGGGGPRSPKHAKSAVQAAQVRAAAHSANAYNQFA